MGATNFYMGSLRYSPCGRKRKNHMLTSVKRNKPEFKPMKQEILNKLNDDLKNEWKHHSFYLHL